MNASSTATMELEDVKVMEKEKTMHARRHATRELEDIKVHVKLKLAALWASVMFMYVYVDVIGFFKPGVIEDILAGVVWEFEITQTWAAGSVSADDDPEPDGLPVPGVAGQSESLDEHRRGLAVCPHFDSQCDRRSLGLLLLVRRHRRGGSPVAGYPVCLDVACD